MKKIENNESNNLEKEFIDELNNFDDLNNKNIVQYFQEDISYLLETNISNIVNIYKILEDKYELLLSQNKSNKNLKQFI